MYLIGFDSVHFARPQPSDPIMHRKQKSTMEERITQYVNVENPNVGKNHDSPQAAEYTMREDYNDGSREATTSCTSTSSHGGYNGGNDLFLSLSLSLFHYTHLHTHTVQLTIMFHTLSTLSCVCPKSYLYTYEFRAIYTYGPKGLT